MREPKRLAHRQAERNKARALKQWNWDEDEDVSSSAYRDDSKAEPYEYDRGWFSSSTQVSVL
jgi:hypothetical protein